MGKREREPKMTAADLAYRDQFDRAVRGEIPWSVEGFAEVSEMQQQMAQTPKDDWDHELGKKRIVIEGRELRMNTMHPEVQLHAMIMQRYPNRDEAIAHLWRLGGIQSFVWKNREKLAKRKLLDLEGEQISDVHEALLELLCTSRMIDFRPLRGGTGKEEYFPQSVIDEAVALARSRGDFTPE